MTLLIATRNKHKWEEIAALFNWPSLEIISAEDIPGLPEVEEDGRTFQENAVKKAITCARLSGLWAMADDSGLEVDALGGQPGVLSARFAGTPTNYKANNTKLLEMLSGAKHRAARFRCVIALSSPEGKVKTVEGVCEGTIATEGRGSFGFGYDPLFIPKGYEKTFGELSPAVKMKISHRALALKAAKEQWGELLRKIAAEEIAAEAERHPNNEEEPEPEPKKSLTPIVPQSAIPPPSSGMNRPPPPF